MTELSEIEAERIEADMPKFVDLLKTIKESTGELIEKIDSLTEFVEKGDNDNGMALLGIKNECMAHYLTDLVTLAQSQLNGEQIEGNVVIDRLIEQRVTMERIRPLEDKMRYRIEKLTALAQGNVKKDDPINLRPDVDNLESSSDEDDEEEEATEVGKKSRQDKPKIYKIDKTKLRPMLPPDSAQTAADRALERTKKRALGSSVIREITREAGDEPEQLQTNELFQDDKMGRRRIAEEARIKESEESNFIRINRKKGDRHKERDAMRKSGFTNLTSFADTSVLYDAQDGKDVLDKMKKMKRERKAAKGAAKKGGKRKRK